MGEGTTNDPRTGAKSEPSPGREPSTDLHRDLHGPDYDGLRRHATDGFILRVPHLGIEIRGVDAAISWLQRTNTRVAQRPSAMASLGPYTVYVDDRDPAGGGGDGHWSGDGEDVPNRCHVLELDGDRLVSWCLLASSVEHRFDGLPTAADASDR